MNHPVPHMVRGRGGRFVGGVAMLSHPGPEHPTASGVV